MKVPPVSGDMLVKLGLGVLVLGGVAMLIYTIKSQASAAAGWAAEHLDPTDPNNVAYSTVSTWGGAVVTDQAGPGKTADGGWNAGAWLYDVFNPGTAQAVRDISKPVTTYNGSGWTARAANPSAYPATDAQGNTLYYTT